MEYQGPELYGDFYRLIAEQNPETFRKLLLTSKELGTEIQPVSREYCNLPITAKEIKNYISSSDPYLTFTTPIYPYRPNPKNIIYKEASRAPKGQYINLRTRSRDYAFQDSIYATLYHPQWIEDLLREGYQLDIKSTYQILKRRTYCVRVDPQWAINRTIEIIKSRYRETLENIRTYPPEALTETLYHDSLKDTVLLGVVRSLYNLLPFLTVEPFEEVNNIVTDEGRYLYFLSNYPRLIEEFEAQLRRNP